MSHDRQKVANVPSLLLENNENDLLFQTIGRFCTTMATGVVQLYLSDVNDRTRWNKKCCGVACFIKDGSKRSFFIRVYDIKKQQMIWEQELYNQFFYKTPREYFHMFEADGFQAGMNFSSEDEAMKFKRAIEGKLNERKQKKLERRRQTVAQKGGNRTPGAVPQRTAQSAQPDPSPSATTNVGLNRNNNTSTTSLNSLKKEKKKDAGKKKLTKADIGTPSNFVHVSHVGWDPDKGFDMNNLEPDMQNLFQSVGIKPDDNLDKDTIDFIYDFVEKNGGIEAVKKATSRPSASVPPPPPSRTAGPPPPPPSRTALPPPPPPSRAGPPSMRGTAPPPPPPSRAIPAPPRAPSAAPPPPPHSISAPPPPPPSTIAAPPPPAAGAPPPPPPPPPTMGSAPPAEDALGRGALLDAIRGGAPLKHAQASNNEAPAKSAGSRDQLLDSIRHGAQLKKVEEPEDRPLSTPMDATGLVGALAKALASRRPACGHSDDSDDSDDDDDDVSDDDDDWDD